MGQTLRRSLISKILLFTAFLVGIAFQGGYSQTMLSPGDLVIVTVNADANQDGNKTFDFIPLVDLESGTEIKFTDAAYDGESEELKTNEGTVTFTTQGKISAGTVITYTGNEESGFSSSGSFNPAKSGDNIIVYQGKSNSSPTYLYGVGWAKGSTVWEYDSGSSSNNRSDIPPNLSEEENTILSLGTTNNYQYNYNNGLEGTANTLLSLVGDESNWNEDDDNAFSSFSSNFTLVDPPTIAFTESALTASEGDGTADLIVELVEADDKAVDVEVSFLSNSSTATNGDDFKNFSTETVSFDDQASTGDTWTVSIDLENDGEFEASEKAVFQLQNNSEGTIIDPQELTLTIEDDDAPDIVFNEINADPGDDANGDSELDSDTDEFIEWVNNTDKDIDISGWKFFDSSSGTERFVFPDGTVVGAGNAVVLFDDDDEVQPRGNFGGAIVFSDGELNLNNTSEVLKLEDTHGNVVTKTEYPNEASGESNVLNPELEGDSYIDHSDAEGANGALSSPGTQVDGTPFGSKFAIGIRGTEGWRMISSPVQDATFDDFFGDFWMQGLKESDDQGGDATIFSWSESGGEEGGIFEVPENGDMTETIEPGKGYIVYVFEDDEFTTPGVQGGFPKIINTDGTENNTVNISVTATDETGNGSIDENEGWNLLGNPFGTDISVAALIDALEDANENVQTNIQVWDHTAGNGQGGFVELSEGDQLAPFQAFFVKYTADDIDADVTFNRDDLAANSGADYYKTNISEKAVFDLELHGEEYYDTYSLEFSENGTTDLDRYDAYKLFSLNPNSINLFSEHKNNRLQKNALPIDLKSTIEIPLAFEVNDRSSLTFRWDNELQDIPTEWDLILIDEETGREIDLRRDEEYSFNVEDSGEQKNTSTSDENKLLNKSSDSQDSRFTLSVQPNTQSTASNDLPESVKLNPNYPNPFNPTTTIPYELTEESDVLLTVWNMIGQRVATLVDGTVEAGTHEVSWNASDMPSGMYIARFEVNGTVFTRKMTLIK